MAETQHELGGQFQFVRPSRGVEPRTMEDPVVVVSQTAYPDTWRDAARWVVTFLNGLRISVPLLTIRGVLSGDCRPPGGESFIARDDPGMTETVPIDFKRAISESFTVLS